MKISIIAVGRLSRGPEHELFQGYLKRLRWPVSVIEVAERRGLKGAQRQQREAELVAQALPRDAIVAVLDRQGRTISSGEFADWLSDLSNRSNKPLAFVVGGAEGLTTEFMAQADHRLSFGPMTWPHLLARVMLAEQLFRAQSILANHPYHRD